RIGGRIHTVHSAEALPAELGAEFIHGRPHEIWHIIQQQGWPTHEVDGDEWHSENGRLQAGGEAFSAMDNVFGRLKNVRADQSFDNFLRHSCGGCREEDRRWARQFVSGFHAGDPELIGVEWLVRSIKADEEIEGDRAFRLLNGYDALIAYLHTSAGAKVDLQTIVREVQWRKGSVVARAHSAEDETEYHARAAVITLPLSVLKLSGEGRVHFDPELNAVNAAVSNLEIGSALRIVFDFRKRFWDTIRAGGKTLANLSFLFSHEEFFPTWWTAMPDRSARLTGWTGGLQARRLSSLSREAICDRALSSLARILNVGKREIEDLVSAWHTHDWDNDAHALGAYSYARAGGAQASSDLSIPIEQTLFFAGEHCDVSGHNGTVHGAMASGHRAATQLLSAFLA
ncbi:MAG: FAD-dependent oxidoreductase, partial [Acidobacteriaceae bacterium]|nr:FAD-dependent oxidoreductase [Acidobacteriaceae bacterium]